MKTSDIDPLDAREWMAQERGLRAARTGEADDPASAARDPRADIEAGRDYRRVASAIATAPRSLPPADFAAAVAARAGAPANGFERNLAASLLLLLGAAAPIAALSAIGPAWHALRFGLGGSTLGWAAVVAACMGITWTVGQLRTLRVR